MSGKGGDIMLYELEARFLDDQLLTLEELARRAQIHPQMLEDLVRWGLVEPMVDDPEPLFSEEVVPTLWRLLRLRRDLGINLPGLGLVLELLERIDQLEREVAWLKCRLG